MDNCIFCKIVKGELPAIKVYEDDSFLGFMDIRPLNKGHVQLIPKTHYRWTWDVPNFGDYWEAGRKVAKALMKGMGAKMVEFLTHGMEVPHAHIWIVPIYGDEGFIKSENRLSFDNSKLEEFAESIKKNL